MDFGAVRPQSMARGTQHPFCRRRQKLASSERDYMYVLQLTQVCSHQRSSHCLPLDAKRDIPDDPGSRTAKLNSGATSMHSLTPLSGQVAVVTGAGRGIGAAIAHKLAALGATVAVCGRTLKTLEATTSSISALGGHARTLACDVNDLESVQTLA